MFDEKIVERNIAGRKLKLSTGKIARQTHGAVLVEYGETVLLATAVRSEVAKEGIDFFPLTVDFIEKYYSSGKIPGGFYKRETKPSTKATLTARLIDRPIRPLFPEGFYNDVQIVITVLSYDEKNTPDYLGIIGASAALTISDIPFLGPVAGVIVGYKDGNFILNPTPEELLESDIELSVAGTKDAIMMVEAGANEVSEETMLEAIKFGHEAIKEIISLQEEFQNIAGKEKLEVIAQSFNEEIVNYVNQYRDNLEKAILTIGKQNQAEAVANLKSIVVEKYENDNIDKIESEEYEFNLSELKNYFEELMKQLVRETIVQKHFRTDGRKLDEVRPIAIETGVLPIPHGSALFTRGETQALVVTTLGTKEDEQIVDGLDAEERKKFFLHYNFPQYSVGEIGFLRGPGRRELGHGNLAERALSYVIPSGEDFPYTIRVVSEITESNGSSSQASICGGSLSLMAAGVPIKSAVSGIAMGLIKEGNDYAILSDIMGLEDHLGDMDFKVAGTKKGITALQMDIKIKGINEEIMKNALEQANSGRMHILNLMNQAISKPNELSEKVPRMQVINVNPKFIAEIIGPSGKNIKSIIEKTSAKIDIDDTGKIVIFADSKENIEKAVSLISIHSFEPKVGDVFDGRVVRITKFGAFVELAPGKDGLVHISEISHARVKTVEEVLKIDEIIKVKVKEIDENGKINLSRKEFLAGNQ
ncbi:MAG: polyribonucleotide nucleotidyltransferase [Fusobacteria bacterium]|nr:polyribonucleotide nucleotidyltransferase [Fusobacteriota bacterium]